MSPLGRAVHRVPAREGELKKNTKGIHKIHIGVREKNMITGSPKKAGEYGGKKTIRFKSKMDRGRKR